MLNERFSEEVIKSTRIIAGLLAGIFTALAGVAAYIQSSFGLYIFSAAIVLCLLVTAVSHFVKPKILIPKKSLGFFDIDWQ